MNNFKVLEKVGEGAFAVVYKVQRISDGRIYALKKMKLTAVSQKEVNNCLNEIRLLASLSHDNIIGYKEAFHQEPTNSLCVVTQFAVDGDLASKVKARAKRYNYFQEQFIWKVAIQTLQGLNYLHSMRIIHRDVKNANIFMNEGVVKIGDFNVSTVNKDGMARTQTGTPYYVCPQIWNNATYDSKCDIWSLGCVLFELTALKPPFQAQSMSELKNKVLRGVFNSLPSKYSKQLTGLIKQCLKLKPNDRPSCNDLLKSEAVRQKLASYGLESLLQNKAAKVKLIQTIKLPRQMRLLKEKLPIPNYQGRRRANTPCERENVLQKRKASYSKPHNQPLATDRDQKQTERQRDRISFAVSKSIQKLEPMHSEKYQKNENRHPNQHLPTERSDVQAQKERARIQSAVAKGIPRRQPSRWDLPAEKSVQSPQLPPLRG